ncbi:DUF1565 domain-containing protein [bacterium]|nr:DUF1565 domain-containing protein [bacterium]
MKVRRNILSTSIAVVLLMLAFTVVGACAANYFVKTTGANGNDGQTWPQAWKTLTYALATAPVGSTIYVGAGVYSPTNGETFPLAVGSVNDGTTLLGKGMGISIIDAEADENNIARVMNIEGVSNFVLEGFTITGGYVASTSSDNHNSNVSVANGGGIYCNNCTELYIQDCEISDNYAKGTYASRDGEGNYNWGGQNPPALAGGGGIYLRNCKSGSEPTVFVDNCLIHGNETGMGGGGICHNYTPAIVSDCCIFDNSASRGGGVYWFDYIHNGSKIEHVLFNDLIIQNKIVDAAYGNNGDGDLGGGVYMSNWGINQKFRIYSTTVADNNGYEVYVDNTCENADLKGANNIFWPDGGESGDKKGFYDDGYNGGVPMTYSDIW